MKKQDYENLPAYLKPLANELVRVGTAVDEILAILQRLEAYDQEGL
jgi:hypothetical protein